MYTLICNKLVWSCFKESCNVALLQDLLVSQNILTKSWNVFSRCINTFQYTSYDFVLFTILSLHLQNMFVFNLTAIKFTDIFKFHSLTKIVTHIHKLAEIPPQYHNEAQNHWLWKSKNRKKQSWPGVCFTSAA